VLVADLNYVLKVPRLSFEDVVEPCQEVGAWGQMNL
jgi:hypothetical protein